ncbi:MAG: GTP cyclohydrolase II [Candidatus Kariarchaeaceae archaeon]
MNSFARLEEKYSWEGYKDVEEKDVQKVAEAKLPSQFGDFRIIGFENNIDLKEHVAIVHGEIEHTENILVRLHSECLTGDVLGSLRCDCRDQLETSLRNVGKAEAGIVLYLRQEGRGIGLINKLRAYQLQDTGLDTVDANLALGFEDDIRDYEVAAEMLKLLKVKSVRLMTNNPKKIEALNDYGIIVTERVAHVMKANKHNEFYLETKAKRSSHMLPYN